MGVTVDGCTDPRTPTGLGRGSLSRCIDYLFILAIHHTHLPINVTGRENNL